MTRFEHISEPAAETAEHEAGYSDESVQENESAQSRLTATLENANRISSELEKDSETAHSIGKELGLDQDQDAINVESAYQSRLSGLKQRARRLATNAALVGSLVFGGTAFAAEPNATEPVSLEQETVASIIAPQVEEQATPDIVVHPVAPLSLDATASEQSNQDQFDKGSHDTINRVVNACLDPQNGGCLQEVVSAVATQGIKNAIPFKSGLSSIRESVGNATLPEGERALGVLRGVASFLGDVALFSSGAGIVKFAQLYKAVSLARDAKDAAKFYSENKEMINAFLDLAFNGRETDKVVVQERLALESGQ